LLEADEARRRKSPTFQKRLEAVNKQKKREEEAQLAAELKAKMKEEQMQRES
jgi:hypothetical protein